MKKKNNWSIKETEIKSATTENRKWKMPEPRLSASQKGWQSWAMTADILQTFTLSTLKTRLDHLVN